MQLQEHNLTGHTIDPDSLLHDGVLSIDHHAVGQKTIFVSTVASLTSVNIPGELSIRCLPRRVNLHVHINRRSNSKSPVAAVAARLDRHTQQSGQRTVIRRSWCGGF